MNSVSVLVYICCELWFVFDHCVCRMYFSVTLLYQLMNQCLMYLRSFNSTVILV